MINPTRPKLKINYNCFLTSSHDENVKSNILVNPQRISLALCQTQKVVGEIFSVFNSAVTHMCNHRVLRKILLLTSQYFCISSFEVILVVALTTTSLYFAWLWRKGSRFRCFYKVFGLSYQYCIICLNYDVTICHLWRHSQRTRTKKCFEGRYIFKDFM